MIIKKSNTLFVRNMKLKFKSNSRKGKSGDVNYSKSKFKLIFLLKKCKSPLTWKELIKKTGWHQVELKRVLDDLLSSKHVKKINGKYCFVDYPYWKYLDSPSRLKLDYIKKIKETVLSDILVYDPLIVLNINKKDFDFSEIEKINKNCKDIQISTHKINNIILENRKKIIKKSIKQYVEKSNKIFKNLLKNNLEEFILFISSLHGTIEISSLRYIFNKKDSKMSQVYFKLSPYQRLKLIKMIQDIQNETKKKYPVILNTIWI